MRVLMLCKACVVGIYQPKLEAIARLGVDLRVLVPPAWRDERGVLPLERAFTSGYDLRVVPIWLNGSFHLHWYPTLGREIEQFRPDIVHIDEEPYNLAAWGALWWARHTGARSVAFSWQNIARVYPPPFRQGERWTLAHLDALIAGTDSAAEVWRSKGYTGSIAVIPQFGSDATLFHPPETQPARPFAIGYVGRLVPEKGIDLLLKAAAALTGDWRVVLVGGGTIRAELERLAAHLNIGDRVEFVPQIASTAMPAQYHRFDALVLPSRTVANWKEQFGRVLVEAMMSGVPVIGADSGAIPGVIGTAGLIFPEGDADALAGHLRALHTDSALRADLAQRGRDRALHHFTHEGIAAATVQVYRDLLSAPPGK
jgi:glycosyltransferase involved in cell wall biosynthesis